MCAKQEQSKATEKSWGSFVDIMMASLVARWVKNPPAMQETQVESLRREDSLEKDEYLTPTSTA